MVLHDCERRGPDIKRAGELSCVGQTTAAQELHERERLAGARQSAAHRFAILIQAASETFHALDFDYALVL
jgi:hypothetical protein